tara:strand:- start:6115 stop:6759 length:645 start_codon:yes stop_codon:yes gene_type:complete
MKVKRRRYNNGGVTDPPKKWGGYDSRYEMLIAKKAAKDKSLKDKDDRPEYAEFGNFRYPLRHEFTDRDPSQGLSQPEPDADMIAQYAETIKKEAQRYGKDKTDMTSAERDQYNRKYKSTVGSSVGRTNWTFNQAFSEARGLGKKTFQMKDKDGSWRTYSTRRADETPEQFEKSFILDSPEQKASNEMRTARERIPYGPGNPTFNINYQDKRLKW